MAYNLPNDEVSMEPVRIDPADEASVRSLDQDEEPEKPKGNGTLIKSTVKPISTMSPEEVCHHVLQ